MVKRSMTLAQRQAAARRRRLAAARRAHARRAANASALANALGGLSIHVAPMNVNTPPGSPMNINKPFLKRKRNNNNGNVNEARPAKRRLRA